MTDAELRIGFARAFLSQARSDWEVYKLLRTTELPACHQLHYLQMAGEKLAKAYRLRDTFSPIQELTAHHTGFAKFMKQYLLSPRFKDRYAGRTARLQSLMRDAEKLAREIERLAPAIEKAQVPANTEYPWEAGGRVIAPCEWSFEALSLLKASRGRTFLKLLEEAFRDYDETELA